MKKTLIFDCDGVLLDTERLLNQVFAECLAEIGLHLTVDEAVHHFKGISTKDCLTKLQNQWNLSIPEHFESNYEIRANERYLTQLETITDIEFALDTLTHHPKCVASGSHPTRIKNGLIQKQLIHHFGEAIFTSTQVKKGKPAPDLFLFSAKKMQASIDDCIVIEDSIPGVKAAVAANMQVLGFADLTSEAELRNAGATITFTQMKELPYLINQIIIS